MIFNDFEVDDEDFEVEDGWIDRMREGKIEPKTKQIYDRKIVLLKSWLIANHGDMIIDDDMRNSITSGM